MKNEKLKSSSDQQVFNLSKIDLNNKELIKALERLPTTEQFMTNVKQNNIEFIIPDLRSIHNVVKELLPKPNKGLWEPQFNLDPFILSYMALLYQNRDKKNQQEKDQQFGKQEEGNNVEAKPSEDKKEDTTPQRISKL